MCVLALLPYFIPLASSIGQKATMSSRYTAVRVIRMNDRRVRAAWVRHLNTLRVRPGPGRQDVELDVYRLQDGTEVVCVSSDSGCRLLPQEVSLAAEQEA